MTVEFLREAAALMRERADLPYVKGEWRADGRYIRKTSASRRIHFPAHAEASCCIYEAEDEKVVNEAIAEHIASWHPAVALAVADWLERVAWLLDHGCTSPDEPRSALAVAAAYLGRQP